MSDLFYNLIKNFKIMKKVIYSVAVVAAFALASCGGGPSICDCVKMGEEMTKDMADSGMDEAKMKEIEAKYKDKAEACKKMGEGKSDEDKAKMMEEAKNCK